MTNIKKCNTCLIEKDVTEFERMSSQYVRPMCKSCYNKRRRTTQGGAERQRLHRELRVSEEVSRANCRLVKLFTKKKAYWLALEYKGFEFEIRMSSFLQGVRPWRSHKQSKLYVGFYLYKFLDEHGSVLYIGKSSKLIHRLIKHFAESSVSAEGNDWKLTVTKVSAMKCASEADMHVLEVYLINKLKPKFNKSEMAYDSLTFEIATDEFKEVWVANVYDK
ncbi:hypothetical protein VPHK120G1_0076 [Vibrio phage K120 g1]